MKYFLGFLAMWLLLSLFAGPFIGIAGAAVVAGLAMVSANEDDEKETKEKQQQEKLDRLEKLLQEKGGK